jgi:hypothetical protein
MKYLFFIFIIAFVGCKKDCEQTSDNLLGEWHSENYTFTLNDSLAQICDAKGFCCASSYYYNQPAQTLYFCGNIWTVQFDCKSLTVTDQTGEVIEFE